MEQSWGCRTALGGVVQWHSAGERGPMVQLFPGLQEALGSIPRIHHKIVMRRMIKSYFVLEIFLT